MPIVEYVVLEVVGETSALLSKSLKSLLYSIARMQKNEMKENIYILKQKGLFPLKWNYFPKKYDIWSVDKRKPTGAYRKLFNKMYIVTKERENAYG